ncbi:MAG: succinylglutamate desuccinylase/aspartoacylase family protein [Planctomycetota bacterium]
MNQIETAAPTPHVHTPLQRVLGEFGTGVPGPLLVAVGGVHGNEPSGVRAIEKVFGALHASGTPIRGRFVGLAGNLAALAAGERYLDVDLNRIWAEEAATTKQWASAREVVERDSLQRAFDEQLAGNWTQVIVADLHSTSASGGGFVVMADTLRNRGVARHLPIPVILGLEETVFGTLVESICEQGHVAICIEGGQHQDPTTVDHHESALWILLVEMGLIDRSAVPDLSAHVTRMQACGGRCPSVMEIRYRHQLHAGDRFAMKPGMKNFDRVREDEALAKAGPTLTQDVLSPLDGYLLMPLYQPKGDDGFFIVRAVRPLWLTLSTVLRRLRLDRFLSWLPGVDRDPHHAGWLRVNRRVARFLAVQFFHLFGYRLCGVDGRVLVLSRRREGRAPRNIR